MDLFEHADRYPNAPGYRATDTSKAAADSMKPSAGFLQLEVLRALRDLGEATADDCAAWLRTDKLSIRPRCTELKAAGTIVDTGRRARNASGRSAIVWRIATTN